MTIYIRYLCIIALCILLNAHVGLAQSSWTPDRKYAQLYAGNFANFALGEAMQLQNWHRLDDFKPIYLLSAGYGFEYDLYDKVLSIGAEMSYTGHFAYNDAWKSEFSFVPYLKFSFKHLSEHLPFYIKFGNGISWTPSTPKVEQKYGYGKPNKRSSYKMENSIMNLLFWEFGVHVGENVEIFTRIHHKCTGYGLYDKYGKVGSVNYHTLGVRFFF